LAGATLTVAGHDHLSASVGAGATRPGDLFDSCGTADALAPALPPPVPSPAVGPGAPRPGHLFDSCGTAEALVRAVPPPVARADVRRLVAAHVTVGWHVLPGRQALLGAARAGRAP